MPIDLPYPQSPDYLPGNYGQWSLRAKTRPTVERGYFTGFGDEPSGHYIIRDGHVWMSTSRLERESHAIHLKYAKGNVVVCGVGMGMYLFNIASLPSVNQIVAVDLDSATIDLVRGATHFQAWNGVEKIRFVNKNALELTAADIDLPEVDYLYVDIWPELGNPDALPQTQAIQSVVKARKVGWWGQEIDFMAWLQDNRPPTHKPAMEDFIDFTEVIDLPIEEQTASYFLGCTQAGSVFASYSSLSFATNSRKAK